MARKKKEEKNNNIDLGSWTCPVRWSDITLKQFQDIQRYYADKEKKVDVRDIVHILCGKTRDEVNLLPTEFLEKILENLSFLSEEPVHQEPQSSIVIKGEKYVINIMEKLKAGEYIDTDTLIKQDKYNYAALFAILCRKEGEVYNDDFIANTLDDRIKMFEEQPCYQHIPFGKFFHELLSHIAETFPALFSSGGSNKPHSKEYRKFCERWGYLKVSYDLVEDKIVYLEKLQQIYLTSFLTYLCYQCDKSEVEEIEDRFMENYRKLHKNGV